MPWIGLHQGLDKLLRVDDTGSCEDGRVSCILHLVSVLHMSIRRDIDTSTIRGHTLTGANGSMFESPEDHESALMPARETSPRAISSSCTSTIKGIPLLFTSWLSKFRNRE